MPTYKHKDTGKRFFFIHIPKTAGRFLQQNFINNNFEPEQNIWDWIDGIETAHFHRELYQKHLNISQTIPLDTLFLTSQFSFFSFSQLSEHD